MSEPRYCLGVIGGSGINGIGNADVEDEHTVDTPYGVPSAPVVFARSARADILFLPRHGVGHRIPPSAVNVRANVYALKMLGATHVVSVSAVGSLRGSIEPGHLVAVNQIIDRTFRRVSTFFDEPGIAAHVGFADPVCPSLRAALISAVREGVPDAMLHNQGTIVVIEGPRFSTRAESEQYRSMGADVIGMNAMPEAALSRSRTPVRAPRALDGLRLLASRRGTGERGHGRRNHAAERGKGHSCHSRTHYSTPGPRREPRTSLSRRRDHDVT